MRRCSSSTLNFGGARGELLKTSKVAGSFIASVELKDSCIPSAPSSTLNFGDARGELGRCVRVAAPPMVEHRDLARKKTT